MEMSPRTCAEDRRAPLLRLTATCLLALVLAACALSPEPEPKPEDKTEQEKKPVISEATRSAFEAAVADLNAERFEQAAERLEPLIGHEPPLPGAQLNLGIAYRNLERFEAAEQALRGAIEHRPDWPAPYVELGIVLRQQGRFDEARKAYERALSIDDGNATAHINLGVLCDLYLQDFQCAVGHYERYQALTSEEDRQVKLWIADLNRRMENQ